MVQCSIQSECRDWVNCVRACGDDNIQCPSFCGFYYQSELINKTNLCLFESDCIDLGFDQYQDYNPEGRPSLTLDGIDGNYWFAASYGGDHIFRYDCQKFQFKEVHANRLNVRFSVPLTKDGQTKLTETEGSFQWIDDGAVEVKYDNFVGYHELWYIAHKSEVGFLAHVCFTKGGVCHDYGAVLLAKKPLNSWSVAQTQGLAADLKGFYGLAIEDLVPTGVDGCQ